MEYDDFLDVYGSTMFEGTIPGAMELGEIGPRSNETELFRVLLEIGKCYEHAESTRRQGYGINKRYYTTNPLRYVGRFLGYSIINRDSIEAAIFQLYDTAEQNVVYFSHTGDTFFREVEPCRRPRLPVGLTRDIANVTPRTEGSNYGLRALESRRNALTTAQIADRFLHPSSSSRSSSRSSTQSRRGPKRDGKKKKKDTRKKHSKK